HLVRLIEGDPKRAVAYKGALLPALSKLGKPGPAARKRLAALLAGHAKALGRLRTGLQELAGATAEEAPHDAEDLAGPPPGLAKAWAAVREKSWTAGVKLPKGAGEKRLAAAERALGAPLPEDFRSFYALHDGGDGGETFAGLMLLDIAACVST